MGHALSAWYHRVPEKFDGLALEYDDEGAGEVPTQCHCSHDQDGAIEGMAHFSQEAVIEEEDGELDAGHGELVYNFGSEEDLS